MTKATTCSDTVTVGHHSCEVSVTGKNACNKNLDVRSLELTGFPLHLSDRGEECTGVARCAGAHTVLGVLVHLQGQNMKQIC